MEAAPRSVRDGDNVNSALSSPIATDTRSGIRRIVVNATIPNRWSLRGTTIAYFTLFQIKPRWRQNIGFFVKVS